MSGLLWGLATALAALLVLAIAVLATPVKLAFVVSTSPRWRLMIAARLLGGVTPPIPIHDSARRRPKREKPPAKERRWAGMSRKTRASLPRAIAGAPRLVTGLLRPIHLERLAVDADIGLADPADTGQFFGWFAAATYVLPSTSALSIDVRPDFSGPRASGEVGAELSFVPVAFIPPGVRFAWRVFGPRA